MDKISRQARSRNMSAIRGSNTKPEIRVRSILHSMGFRFRLHQSDLPGKPDIVLKKHNTVIFVHGCFWHRHRNCRKSTVPKTNTETWIAKFRENQKRDALNEKKITELGWRLIKIWECETEDTNALRKRINECFRSSEAD